MINEIKEIQERLDYHKAIGIEPEYSEDLITTGELQRLLDYITNLQRQLVYCLKYETGAGIRDCKMALEKCDYNYNTAYKYLRLISDGVARWKIVDGQRVKWTDEDYIKCARGDE